MKTYNFTNRVIPSNFIEKVRPSLEVDVKFWAKADKIRGGGWRYKISFDGGR